MQTSHQMQTVPGQYMQIVQQHARFVFFFLQIGTNCYFRGLSTPLATIAPRLPPVVVAQNHRALNNT